ncbi:CHY zinc finger protein [Streptococcus massiliensis]|uniref:Helper of Tim protein 13 n=1 Tax=Streptococcus massiliensis TaxID=313439 RepID=A0A380KYK2_9STRE|nr:CHY zinc finger protein [Streptococcus massiliensis]SUN76207.1 helper of Tim protein 13 [Streptococcus massiliensis]
MIKVYGVNLDKETRCQHYHTDLDIVALKCFTCQKYYACYQCHDFLNEHSFTAYPKSLTSDKVVLCGVCQSELTLAQYESATHCPFCGRAFNPRCQLHKDIYFRD